MQKKIFRGLHRTSDDPLFPHILGKAKAHRRLIYFSSTMPETDTNGGGEPDAKRPKVDDIKAPAIKLNKSKSWEAELTPKSPTERSERMR